MISRGAQISLWRILRYALRSVLTLTTIAVVGTVFFRWYRGVASLEDARSRLLLSLIGLCAAGWVGALLAATVRRFPRTTTLAAVALALSQGLYLTLVWSEWKPYVVLWRLWWITLVGCATLAHVLWLRFRAGSRLNGLERVTIIAAAASGVLLALPVLRRDVLGELPFGYIGLLVVAAMVSWAGTLAAWVRLRRQRPRRPVSRWRKLSWLLASQAGMLTFGFYAGRVTAPAPSALDVPTAALAAVPRDELEAQLAIDLRRLRAVASAVDDLHARSRAFHGDMEARRRAENRSYYLPAEEEELRAQFMTYLAHRAALLRIVATYAGFEGVADERIRTRCFLVGYGAGATVMAASGELVWAYRGHATVRRKLNEPDTAAGLEAGEFDRVYAAVTSDRNSDTFREMAAYFEANRDAWRGAALLPADDFAWLENRIDMSVAQVRGLKFDTGAARFEQVLERVKRDAYTPVYDAQSVVSTLIGDTRMVKRAPFIRPAQIADMKAKLLPGDLLLERRNWYLSNAFLPGFWPHGALYVGTAEDLERLGLARRGSDGAWTSDDANIRAKLHEYLAPAHDGERHTVIESVSEGVIFNSLEESMGADYVAVLRPRVSAGEKSRAIAMAFSHVGKPYDFEFDFFSADKLVCTELLYRSYQGSLHFPLVRIMGRDTLPALEICHKYARERGRDDRELDFVLFLDADPARGAARLASEEDFIASAQRPRGFNE